MTRRQVHRTGRRLTGLLFTVLTGLGLPAARSATADQPAGTQPVTVTVDRVTPASPIRTNKVRPLAVQLTLTNTTAATLPGLRVDAERLYPLTTQKGLEDSLATPPTRGTGDVPIAPVRPLTVSLPPRASVTVVFRTTYSLIVGHGLCLCHDAVYPLLFSVRAPVSAAPAPTLGTAVTYLPVFDQPVTTEQVSWVWSLLDRPHRLDSDTVFEDDDLTQEVSSGGRLDRALAVIEQVSGDVPITLVLDPETLDELQVMATETYRVQDGATTVTGTGRAEAEAWLARLRAVLSNRPEDAVELTPLGDPDVQSVLHHDTTWTNTLPATVASRVSAALGGHVTDTDLSWPASGRVDDATLGSLAAAGRRTVVLDDASAGTLAQSRVVSFASTKAGTVAGALTDRRLENSVRQAVTFPEAATTVIPELLARLAIPVIQSPKQTHVAILTSPRYVDASVADAVQVIEASTRSTFTDPIALSDTVSDPYLPSTTSRLRPAPSVGGLPAQIFSAVGTVDRAASTVRSMLDVPGAAGQDRTAAAEVLASLPLALERLQSSAWRTDGDNASLGVVYSAQLSDAVQATTSGVQIVPPSKLSYTLGSTKSSLPVTVRNGLSLPVRVVVHVSTVGSVPGFTAGNIGAQTIDADSTRTVQLPTTVQRSGRIKVDVQLSAPDGAALGDPIELNVHSTALGRIGVIITIAAGVLLALALVIRFVRGVRQRRRRRLRPPAVADRTPVTT